MIRTRLSLAFMLFNLWQDDETLVMKDRVEGCARNDEGCFNESSSSLFNCRVLFLINFSFADGEYNRIIEIRGERVLLDRDVADSYCTNVSSKDQLFFGEQNGGRIFIDTD